MTLEEKLKEIVERTTLHTVSSTEDFKAFAVDRKFIKEHIALAKALELAMDQLRLIKSCGHYEIPIMITEKQIEKILNGE